MPAAPRLRDQPRLHLAQFSKVRNCGDGPHLASDTTGPSAIPWISAIPRTSRSVSEYDPSRIESAVELLPLERTAFVAKS